jgi:hypothetical protein
LGVHEGVNDELIKSVTSFEAALAYLQGLSTFDADRKLASVSIELADK